MPMTIAPQSVSVHPHLLVHFSPIQPGQTYVLNQAGKACTLGLDIETLAECGAGAWFFDCLKRCHGEGKVAMGSFWKRGPGSAMDAGRIAKLKMTDGKEVPTRKLVLRFVLGTFAPATS